MINVMVNGCNGRMGQIVCDLVNKNSDMVLMGGIDIADLENTSFPVYKDLGKIPQKPDVIIDFSIPAATFNILEYAKDKNIQLVIATTGFSKEQDDKILEYSKFIPIFKSANMSFEINVFMHLLREIAPKLKDNDIEIIETHHNRKIDSPSGTAEMLADTIIEAIGENKHKEYNRHDKHEKRSKDEIGMTSIRGGNIVGEHQVMFFGESESFEIKHTSYSRDVFAEGAIKAAEFIVKKTSGMYNMDDLVCE